MLLVVIIVLFVGFSHKVSDYSEGSRENHKRDDFLTGFGGSFRNLMIFNYHIALSLEQIQRDRGELSSHGFLNRVIEEVHAFLLVDVIVPIQVHEIVVHLLGHPEVNIILLSAIVTWLMRSHVVLPFCPVNELVTVGVISIENLVALDLALS